MGSSSAHLRTAGLVACNTSAVVCTTPGSCRQFLVASRALLAVPSPRLRGALCRCARHPCMLETWPCQSPGARRPHPPASPPAGLPIQPAAHQALGELREVSYGCRSVVTCRVLTFAGRLLPQFDLSCEESMSEAFAREPGIRPRAHLAPHADAHGRRVLRCEHSQPRVDKSTDHSSWPQCVGTDAVALRSNAAEADNRSQDRRAGALRVVAHEGGRFRCGVCVCARSIHFGSSNR